MDLTPFLPASKYADPTTHDVIMKTIGKLLRVARQANGLTLLELGDRCKCSSSVLSRIELGRRTPGIPMLLIVCSQLGVRLSDIFFIAEDAALGVSHHTPPAQTG